MDVKVLHGTRNSNKEPFVFEFYPILSIFVLASLGSMHCMCVCISLNTPVSLSTHIHSHSGCDLLTRIGSGSPLDSILQTEDSPMAWPSGSRMWGDPP